MTNVKSEITGEVLSVHSVSIKVSYTIDLILNVRTYFKAKKSNVP